MSFLIFMFYSKLTLLLWFVGESTSVEICFCNYIDIEDYDIHKKSLKFNVSTTIPFQQEGGRGFKTIPFDLFTDLKTLVHFSLYLPVWWFLDVILAVMSLLDF